jgi:hypothetical protein
MPESVTDRPTLANEWWLMLTPGPRYYWNADAIRLPHADTNTSRLAAWYRADGAVGGEYLPHDVTVPKPYKAQRQQRGIPGVGTTLGGFSPDGRNYRTTDPWFTSAAAILRDLAHHLRDGGLLLDTDGLPIGINQATQAYKGSHFAVFPAELIEPFIKAGTRPGDTCVDPFGGTGTTASVAIQWQRNAIICELNPAYAALAEARIGATQPALLTEDVA